VQMTPCLPTSLPELLMSRHRVNMGGLLEYFSFVPYHTPSFPNHLTPARLDFKGGWILAVGRTVQ